MRGLEETTPRGVRPGRAATPAVVLDRSRLEDLEAKAEHRIEAHLDGRGPGRYDVLLPIVRRMRDRLGRKGVVAAVDLFVDEGIFREGERRAAEVAFRRRLRAGDKVRGRNAD